jgi:predicted Zn-dependent peptidase/outer membrane protein OmpA-like peptidoglycan-associated protein
MKYFFKTAASLLIIIFGSTGIYAQDTTDIFRVVTASNGQSFVLSPTNNVGSTIYTDIYFRIGPVYEFDSVSGISFILSKIIDAHIESELKTNGSGRKIKYYSTVDPERIGFHFECALPDLEYVLTIVNKKINSAQFDAEGVDEAKTEFRADLDSLKLLGSYVKDTKVMKKLWGKDYKKVNPYGDQKTYVRLTADDLALFHKKYFLPLNNSIYILGNFPYKETLDEAQNISKGFRSREFNPELINKVIDFRLVITNVQLLTEGREKNAMSISYQNPGARSDRIGTYCAFVLTQLMNNKNGRIQKSMKAAGIKGFKAAYDCANFYGTMVISAQAPDSNVFQGFEVMAQLIHDISQKDYFKDGEIETAQRNIEIEYNDLKANNIRGFMSMVSRYRFSNDERYITSMIDSIKSVNVEQMRNYTSDYYAEHCGVRCLMIPDTSIIDTSSDQYFALDESIGDTKFTYELNKSDIETKEAKQNLQKVIEWLKINPDIHIQINGYADAGEFMKAYNDTILRFIDSTATFHKAMPDATKKGYLRLEMMRAIKIAKAIYEAGIGEDRITGTSMVFNSDSNEGAAENRKCTITLEKIKPEVSLYEYHFGKKKPEDQN